MGSTPLKLQALPRWLLMGALSLPILAHASETPAGPESPPLSVEQITRIVLEHNPYLQAARSSAEGARAGVRSAEAWHD